MTTFSVDVAQDEFGNDRFFVAGPGGDWIDGPYDVRDQAADKATWRNQKHEGMQVKTMLDRLPVGAEFRLSTHSTSFVRWVPVAYSALYRKNEEGLWDQVEAPVLPLVINMSPDHLGFCVGERPIREALKEAGLIKA